MRTIEDLKQMQSLPLDLKISLTKSRIREWVNHYGENNVYISFSGGKDSTVLLNLVREDFPDISAVFVNTGLEYPEIQNFVKTFKNVVIIRPEMRFDSVIKKYGYPVISKEISEAVGDVRNPNYSGKTKMLKLYGLYVDKNGNKSSYNYEKYKPLLNTDFKIGSGCCRVLKKVPVKHYEHETNSVPLIASMAAESRLRTQQWLKNGCNGFDMKRAISNPMSFWTEQDVLKYIYIYKLPICSVYGEIICCTNNDQLCMTDCRNDGQLCTTGCSRTGCIFCAYGVHLQKGETKFQRLKKTHPKQYEYCIGGGTFNRDGMWEPDKNGLGMGHVFNEINKIYGKDFIRY